MALDWDSVLATVRAQIADAVAGKVIPTSTAVVAKNWFLVAPVDAASAEAQAAYWLAVGARVGYPGLIAPARAFYARADGRIKALSSGDVSGIRAVIGEAVSALDAVGAYRDRRMAGVYRGLGLNQRADAIERSQVIAQQQSTAYILTGTAKDTARELAQRGASALERVGDVILDKRPKGTPPWLWWLQRNAWLMVGVGVAGIAAYVYLKPVLAPLLGVRDAAAAASQRAADKASARLGTIARNPRRRRRSRSR